MFLTPKEAQDFTTVQSMLRTILNDDKLKDFIRIPTYSSFVYLVGDTFVKFPDSELAKSHLLNEVSVCSYLNTHVSFETQKFITGQKTCPIGRTNKTLFFAASRQLQGVCADRTDFYQRPHTNFCNSFADILSELHALPKSEVNLLNIPWYIETINETIELMYGRHTPPSFREQLLNSVSNRLLINKNQSLCHLDLHPGNLMVHPDTGKITGVLDFGNAHIAPPIVELNELDTQYTSNITLAICDRYQHNQCTGQKYASHNSGLPGSFLQKTISECCLHLMRE